MASQQLKVKSCNRKFMFKIHNVQIVYYTEVDLKELCFDLSSKNYLVLVPDNFFFFFLKSDLVKVF